MRLKTRWSDWESDGPGPYTFRLVVNRLLRGLRLKGLITAEPGKPEFDELMQECWGALTEPEEWWADIPVVLHGGRTPQMTELDDRILNQMHMLWTAAVGTPGYDKSKWKTLDVLLCERGVRSGMPRDQMPDEEYERLLPRVEKEGE